MAEKYGTNAKEGHLVSHQCPSSLGPSARELVHRAVKVRRVGKRITLRTFDPLVLNVEPHTTKNFNPDPSGDLSTMEAWRYVYNDSGDLVGTSGSMAKGITGSTEPRLRLPRVPATTPLRDPTDGTFPSP